MLLGRFLGTSWELSGLSWSPFGTPDASRTSKSDVKSHFDANLSSELAFKDPNITITISISISISICIEFPFPRELLDITSISFFFLY